MNPKSIENDLLDLTLFSWQNTPEVQLLRNYVQVYARIIKDRQILLILHLKNHEKSMLEVLKKEDYL